MEENLALKYIDTLYSEGGKGVNRWMSIDIVFQKKNMEYLKHKFFAPETYRERSKTSAYFRNLFEVLGVNYDDIEYQYEWYSLAAVIKNMLQEKENSQIYGKIITVNDREQLGKTFPVLSTKPDLVFSNEELMFQGSEFKRKRNDSITDNSLNKLSQKELTKIKLKNHD